MDGLRRINYFVSVVVRELKHQQQTFLFLAVDELASNHARFSFILSPIAARVSKTALLKFSINRVKEQVGIFSHINARINPNSMQKTGEKTITKQLRM